MFSLYVLPEKALSVVDHDQQTASADSDGRGRRLYDVADGQGCSLSDCGIFQEKPEALQGDPSNRRGHRDQRYDISPATRDPRHLVCEKRLLLSVCDFCPDARGFCLDEQPNAGQGLIETAAEDTHELDVRGPVMDGRLERKLSVDFVFLDRMAEKLRSMSRGPSHQPGGRRVEVADDDVRRHAQPACRTQATVRADQEISVAQPAAEILVRPQRAIRDYDGCLRQAAPDGSAALPAGPEGSVRR